MWLNITLVLNARHKKARRFLMHRRVHGHLDSKGRAIKSNITTSVKLYYVELCAYSQGRDDDNSRS